MAHDFWQALLALAACFVPLGFAWFALTRTARRHRRRDAKAVRRKDSTMR